MDNKVDGCGMQSTVNAEKSDPGVTVPGYAVRTALHVAERAADNANRLLRECEQQRDTLARQLGDAQRKADALKGERDYHTSLVRSLAAALSS